MPTNAEIAAAAAVASVLAAPDYYAAIDAPRTASMAELRQCYVRTSLRVHPDKNQHPNATQAFQRVAAAWRELGDEQSRYYYDQQLSYDSDCINSSSFAHVEPDEAFASFARAAAACASTGGFNDSADAMYFAQMAQAQARNSYGMYQNPYGNPYGQAPPDVSLQSAGSGVAYAAGLWTAGLATSAVGFVSLGNFMRRIAVIQGFGQVAIGGIAAYQNPEIRKSIDFKVMEVSTALKVAERTAPVKAALGSVGAKMRNRIEDVACSEIVGQLGSALGSMPSCIPRSRRIAGESPPSALEAGARATLAGLSAAAALNGRLCEVVRFEKQKERWVVRVLPRGVRVLPSGGSDLGRAEGCAPESMKLVRADNLRLEAPLSLENIPRTSMHFV